MPISVSCLECGKGLKAPDALAGKKAKCPGCGAIVPIPKAVVDAEEVDDDPPPLPKKKTQAAEDFDEPFDDLDDGGVDVSEESSEKRKPCPMCGEMILAAAAKCRFCGEIFDARVKQSSSGRRRGGVEYAGFWIRVAAAIVDGVVVFLIAGVIGFIVGIVVGGAIAGGGGNIGNAQATLRLVGNVIGLVVGWLYSALQESSEKQATVGKKMLGLVVTDLDGGRISFGRASGRHFAKILSGCLLAIGYMMAGFTEKKQALHDMMAGTLVVRG